MSKLIIKKNKGKLIYKDHKSHSRLYLDQLSDEEIWIASGVFVQYLNKTYGLNSKEYFNLIIYGNKDYIPLCKCGLPRKFVSLSRGYSPTCGGRDCVSKKLSNHAKSQHSDKESTLSIALGNLHNSEEFKKSLSTRTRELNKKLWEDPEYRKKMSENSKISINSWKSKSKAKYKSFLRSGRADDLCIFYIGLTESNDIKFGITGTNLDKGRCNRKWRLGLKSIHRLVNSNRLTVAKIELELKLYLGSNSEYTHYKNLHKIIDFVRNFNV